MIHLRRALLLSIVCALPLTGCRKAAPPEEPTPPAPVKAAHAESVELAEWIDLIGSTQPLPDQTARITTIVPGRVVQVLAGSKGKAIVEGQRVDKDHIIVQLDDRVARAQRDKTAALIEELQEIKKQADLANKLAKLDLDRLQKLFPPGTVDPMSIPLVSKIEIDKANIALLDSVSKQKGAEAKEKALQLEKKSLDVQVEYHELRSPIVGELGTVQVVPGQTLSAGTTVAEVVNLETIDVIAFASPHAAAKLRVGQNARLLAKDQPDADADSLSGTLTYIGLQAQAETGNFLVKARFTNKDLRYRANQVVRLEVEVQKKKARLVIKESALMEDHDPPFVVLAQKVETKKNKDGKDETLGEARKVYAYIGVRDREKRTVEILRLEDPGKKDSFPLDKALFLYEGGHGLHDGDPLKIESKHP